MKRYVAFLRGINVGGHNILRMGDLVDHFASLGCVNTRTYIQSGNAVFGFAGDARQLAHDIAAVINGNHGFHPGVQILTVDQVETAIVSNPFPGARDEPKSLHLGFMELPPPNPDLEALMKLKDESESFLIVGSVFYLHAPDGVGNSRLAARAEKLLGVSMTSRNWRTVTKMVELSGTVSLE